MKKNIVFSSLRIVTLSYCDGVTMTTG